MKFKSTYILALVAILFGAYIYFVEIKKADRDQIEKENSQKLLAFDPSQVSKISLKNSFGEFELEKDKDGAWQLTKGSDVEKPFLAEESTVTSFLNFLSNEKYDQVVAEKGAVLKNFGLDPAKLTVTLTMKDGNQKTVMVGNDGALPGKLYALVDGRVLFAGQGIRYQVDKNSKELKDKRVFRGHREELSKVVVKIKGKESTSLINKDKKWFIEKPKLEPADDEAVISFFNGLEGLRATEFAKSEKGLGLEKPDLEIDLFDKQNKPFDVITMGLEKQNSRYVKNKTTDAIYQVFAGSYNSLDKTAADFKDKKTALKFDQENLKSFDIKTGLVDYSFVKSDKGWSLTKPDPNKEVNQTQVSELLNQLSQLKASEFFDKKPEIKNPAGQVVLKDDKGNLLLDLKWGDKTPSGKSVFASTQKSDSLFGIQDSLIKSLPGQTLVQEKKSQDAKASEKNSEIKK